MVELVNLDAGGERGVIVQGGAFAEHVIEDVRYTACEDGSWLGDLYDYGHGDPVVSERHTDVGAPYLAARIHARAADPEADDARPAAVLRQPLRRRGKLCHWLG